MNARVFAVRETGEVDLRAATEATQLIIAATSDQSIARASALLAPRLEGDRDGLVRTFVRGLGHLHMALGTVQGPRRPLGRGELVLLRTSPYGVATRVLDILLETVNAVESLSREIDFSGSYVAAGIVPLPILDGEHEDDALFAGSLAAQTGFELGHEALSAFADDRRLPLLGQMITGEVFGGATLEIDDATLLAEDAIRLFNRRVIERSVSVERRDWQETLLLMHQALGGGQLDDAWALVNDLTSAIARMRITRVTVG